MDGVLLHHDARDGARARKGGAAVCRSGAEVLRALRGDREGDEYARRRRVVVGGRWVLLRSDAVAVGAADAEAALDGRVHSRCSPSSRSTTNCSSSCRYSSIGSSGSSRTARSSRARSRASSISIVILCSRSRPANASCAYSAYMLDESEFLSPYGIRSMSRVHRDHPYTLDRDGRRYEVRYAPAESETGVFGGNSNWRGPVWFPVNYLLVEALKRYHHFYGDTLLVECPTGSGRRMNLRRKSPTRSSGGYVNTISSPTAKGRRPCHGGNCSLRRRSELPRSRAVLRVLPTAIPVAASARVTRPAGLALAANLIERVAAASKCRATKKP